MREPVKLSDIMFLDIEASGLGDDCFPIEIGFARAIDLSGWSALIRPAGRWLRRGKWETKAEALHGISREMLEQEGLDAWEVARTLNTQLSGKLVFCDGLEFDSHWLGMLFEATPEQAAFDLRPIEPLLKNPGLFLSSDNHAFPGGGIDIPLRRHRALDDAKGLALQFMRKISQRDAL